MKPEDILNKIEENGDNQLLAQQQTKEAVNEVSDTTDLILQKTEEIAQNTKEGELEIDADDVASAAMWSLLRGPKGEKGEMGKQGDKGEKGDGIQLTPEEIAQALKGDEEFIQILKPNENEIITKVIQSIQIPKDGKKGMRGEEGKNGKNGRDADEQKIIKEVFNKIEENIKIPEVTAEDIVEKLSNLKDDSRLSYDSLKDTPNLNSMGRRSSRDYDLIELKDVSITSPTNGQTLTYNSTTGKWTNQTGGGTGTVTNVSSADGNATVANPTTTPVITIVSAPVLQTGRTIAITGDLAYTSPAFDGSGNVTAASTLATVNGNVGTFGSATQASQVTVNAKGLITAAANVTVTPAIGSVTGLAAGISTFLSTPTSANLLAAVTNETGTGLLVFATSPTLTTPLLGTPTSGVLTNCTGLPVAGITSSTTQALGVGSLELGAATDTTLARVSAGTVSIEGVTIATATNTLTLSGKTLTAPIIATIVNTGTLTLPTSTDTLVGRATTDTLTNKTLTTPTITKPVMSATNPTAQTYTPAAAGTATLDLSLSNQHDITFPAGNITIALTNDTNNQIFMVSLTQDATGSRTATFFTTIKWAGGVAPTLTTTANKRDLFGFKRTGASTYDGFVIGQNI